MLRLINQERELAGVEAVELGDNVVAQLHAEAARDGCFMSHWDQDGLQPYMRYSLSGGYQYNGENIYWESHCIEESDAHWAGDEFEMILHAMKAWMASPGHRKNILDPHYKRVHVGVAWGGRGSVFVQHFEADYVNYDLEPDIVGDVLFFSGETLNGIEFEKRPDLRVVIFYDPPPRPLTRGQLARTSCYDYGQVVAGLTGPVPGILRWLDREDEKMYVRCPDPHDVPPDAAAPATGAEVVRIHRQARDARNRQPRSFVVPWVAAMEWRADGQEFAVSTDVAELLGTHGNGIYSVVVWAVVGEEKILISHHSILHGVDLPGKYRSARPASSASGMGDSGERIAGN